MCFKTRNDCSKKLHGNYKPDFDINDISEIIENHVYPNLYKLLQVAISIPWAQLRAKERGVLKIGYEPICYKTVLQIWLFRILREMLLTR
jgi:hypothetical protein